MAGISSKALNFGDPKNKKGYSRNELQNKEFSDGSGLEVHDFNARTYDQQIGRFFQIDPLSEEADQEGWSPYHYSYNNPATFSDPDGKFPIIPLIIIGIGLLTAPKPAIAPTGRPGEAQQIAQSYNNYNTSVITSVIPGGKANKPTQILYQKAANEVRQEVVKKSGDNIKEVFIDAKKHPEAAKHAQEAMNKGVSNEGVVDRTGASTRRKEATKDLKTEKGKDRDEFPPAVINNLGGGSSVKLIPQWDNRGAGSSIGHQLRHVPDNTRVVIKVRLVKNDYIE